MFNLLFINKCQYPEVLDIVFKIYINLTEILMSWISKPLFKIRTVWDIYSTFNNGISTKWFLGDLKYVHSYFGNMKDIV